MYANKMPNGGGVSYETFHLLVGKRLVKTPYVSLPNLLAGKEIVKELLQEDCQPDKLAQQLLPLLEGGERVENLKETFYNYISLFVVTQINKLLKLY